MFAALDALAPAAAVLASSTSAIPASQFTEALAGRARCLVAHPVNPPHLVPVVELCGAPWTAAATIERARAVMTEVGQVPIVVRRELDGFILNRLQGALLSEAMRLVGEGYVSPEDLDKTVAHGLGLRWSFMGPFATIELNAPGGVADYCARYSGILSQARRRSAVARRLGRRARGARRRGARRTADAGRARATNGLARPAAAGAGAAQARTIRLTEQGANIMAEARKVIITCAITGSIHTPSMSPHLPVTPREIADAAVGAAEAGAAIVHLHARDPVDGRPTQDPKYFREFAPDIKRRSNVVHQLHHRRRGDDDDRGAPAAGAAAQARGRLAQHGLDELRPLPDARSASRSSSIDWEREYLAGSDARIFRNTFKDIEYILTSCADNGTRFEIECYDIGHLYTAHHFFERGIVKPPLFIQSVFGILGGIGPHPDDVLHMKRTADRLFGDQYRWSVLGAGRNQLPIAAMSAAMGGNVRVGLEDSLWLGPGKLAESNAAQVRAARQIIEGLGLEVATPDDARRILALKGASERRVLKSPPAGARSVLPESAPEHDFA